MRSYPPGVDTCVRSHAPPESEVGAAGEGNEQSFARETSAETLGKLGDLSTWDDQSVTAGMRAECAAMRGLDSHYPGKYQRLGTYSKEARKRFGDDDVRLILRKEGINDTKAWRAEQIATLYTFDQAVAFPSLRAILQTIPPKQPRHPKPKPNGGDHQAAAPEKPSHALPEPIPEKAILDTFVELGIKVRVLLGDEALDLAVEQIKAHAPETFDEAFVEVL